MSTLSRSTQTPFFPTLRVTTKTPKIRQRPQLVERSTKAESRSKDQLGKNPSTFFVPFFFFTSLFENGGKPKLKATWEQRNKKRKRGPNSSAMTLRKRVAKKIQGFHAENGREKKRPGLKDDKRMGKKFLFVCLGERGIRGGGGGERREERGGGYMRQHLFFFRFLTWSAALVAISNTSRTPSLVLAEHSR